MLGAGRLGAIAVLVLGVSLGARAENLAAPNAISAAAAAPQTATSLPAIVEPPFFAAAVAAGELPPVAQRLPSHPAVISFEASETSPGRYGGTLRLLGGSAKDTRSLVVYGYARLVGYDTSFHIVPDIAESVDVEEGRRFTFHLRPGHRWSDGEPFTSEDFRYYWEDIANDPEMSKFGPPEQLMVDGEKPAVEFPDAVTVRYSWSKPNPDFLPALASAQPLEIFRPAHYLKKFHARYAGLETVKNLAKQAGQRNWVALHFFMDRSYKNDNPDLPTLQPWILKTDPPSDRFVFARNPYYYKIDRNGLQLPYIDQVAMLVVSPQLIPAKVAAGEADLQGAYLSFSNYTFLKRAEKRSGYQVRRWIAAKGSRIALYPNLNNTDPVWRKLFQNADFRRALSLAINREDINNAIFYGLAKPGNNTVLPESELYQPDYASKWATYDPDQAARMLDALGLAKRDSAGIRLLPDGRPLQIVVETAGEETEQTDVLELVRDDWFKIGVALFMKPTEREVFYNRVKAGSTQMAVWSGLENALLNPDLSPAEFSPLNSDQLEWPIWGLFTETRGKSGQAADLDSAKKLISLAKAWDATIDRSERAKIWRDILAIWADQCFTIGIVSGVDQLVVVSDRLRNVPQRGVFNFDPGAFFGIYHPDTFWLADGEQKTAATVAP
jgi:peptide/nickel transport system substrate-binding protein